MRSLFVVTASIALMVVSTRAHAPAGVDDDAIMDQIRRVEVSLPPIKKDGRTLELSLQEWMDALGIPGVSIAVIEDYRIVWARGYGVVEAGTETPVNAATLFQAASISKPLAALALLHFAEQGSFDLDVDINEYLRSWKLPPARSPGPENVTLRHLLAHTAGITPGGFAGYERDAPVPGTIQTLDGKPPANNQPARAVSAPGSAVSYSGLGYVIIELALEDRLGRPFEGIVKTSVLEPVGMHDSTFEQPLPDALIPRAAHGHRATGEAIARGWYVYPELAAAGLWTTPSDLALLAIEVAKSKLGRSNRILSSEWTRRMLTQQKDQMGLGFVIRAGDENGYFAHSGGNQGYRCHFEMLADTGQGVVVMTNSDVGGLITALLKRSVAQAYEWPSRSAPVSDALTDSILAQIDRAKTERTTRKKIEVDERTLAQYVGRYELAPELEFVVTLTAGHLEVRLGDQPRFPIYPETESKFFYEVVDAQISFVKNGAGKTVSLVLHQGGRDQEAKRIH